MGYLFKKMVKIVSWLCWCSGYRNLSVCFFVIVCMRVVSYIVLEEEQPAEKAEEISSEQGEVDRGGAA